VVGSKAGVSMKQPSDWEAKAGVPKETMVSARAAIRKSFLVMVFLVV